MKAIITTLFIFCCLSVSAQDSTKKMVRDSEAGYNDKYPSGLTLSLGALITSNLGFELESTTLFGKGRVKVGFSVGYTYMHFTDTLNVNRLLNEQGNSPIGAIGVGIVSKVYDPSGKVYALTRGTYSIVSNDNRYRATNGLSMMFGVGVKMGSRVFLSWEL